MLSINKRHATPTWLAKRSWKYGAGDGKNNNNHVGIR
jgi:hypothetical protein